MANFNFLSGSSIDIVSTFLFNILEDGDCYMGFAKGTPENQWGINALVQIEHTIGQDSDSYLLSIATSGCSSSDDTKFYDDNSKTLTNASKDKKRIYIARYNTVVDPFLMTPYVFDDHFIGELYLSNINKYWVSIQGLVQNYYELMPYTNEDKTEEYVYCFLNWNQTTSTKLKIKDKSFLSVPTYSTQCNLYMLPASGSFYEKIGENLEKTTNILGESLVTGLIEPSLILDTDVGNILNLGVSATANKKILKNATFKLVGTVVNSMFIGSDELNMSSDIILDHLEFVDSEYSSNNIYTEVSSYESSQKYITFRYPYIDNDYQYIKFVIGANEIKSLAIWQEALPFNSIVPVADSNPPGLDISYLKNTSIHSSIFDVNGLCKINAEDVTFVKELNNSNQISYYSNAGFTIEHITLEGENVSHSGILKNTISVDDIPTNIIDVFDFHSFVIGDEIFIPFKPLSEPTGPGSIYIVEYVTINTVTFTTLIMIDEDLEKDVILRSEPNSINASIILATTTDKEKAVLYEFYNALITKTIPKLGTLNPTDSPTDNIYRQLFISYRPKTSTGVVCTNNIYNGDFSLCGVNFNLNKWKYDNGLLIYLSNKIPIYRKWATADEQFKIIL